MRVMNVEILILLCVALTSAFVKSEEKITNQKDPNSDHAINDEIVSEEIAGSSSGINEVEVSGDSGSGSGEEEEERQPQAQMPKPMGLPFGGLPFKGPVTVTPMEPGVNRQKPFRRPCFFCFPRGRLGRVEITAPGGPFLMNGFGMAGFGVGYPNMGMGLPQGGPVYPGGMGFPEYGPGPYGPGPGNPCCSGGPVPCNCQGNDEGPMQFQELNEETPNHPKAPASDKPMVHSPKAMAGPPIKGFQNIHKPLDLHHKAVAFGKTANKPLGQQLPMKGVMDEPAKKPLGQLPMKGVMDEPANKPLGQIPMKGVMDQPAKKPLNEKMGKQPGKSKEADEEVESKKDKGLEQWVHI